MNDISLPAVAALVVAAIAVAEAALRLPLLTVVRRFAGIWPQARRTMGRQRASDHWKEKALLKLARRSLAASFCLAAMIAALVAVFLAVVFGLSLLLPPLWEFALGPVGLGIATLAALLHLIVRPYARRLLQRP